MLERGLRALRWLAELQTSEKGHFRPIGSNGFYRRGGARAKFDQQPIEAQATVSACLEAYRATADVLVVRTGAARLRLVPRLERSRPGALRPRDRRLPRRPACGPGQREPGSRIHPGLPALAGRDAAGAKHRDEFQGTDRRCSNSLSPMNSRCPSTSNAPARSSSPTSRASSCGRSTPGSPERVARIIARIMALAGGAGRRRCSTRSARSSRSGTRTSATLFWSASSRSASSLPAIEEVSEEQAAADRLLFPGRILAGIRGPVQPVDGPAPRPVGPCRPARCGSSSACGPPAKGTSPRSRSGPASSMPISRIEVLTTHGLRHRAASGAEPALREGRCSAGSSPNWG